MKTILLNSICSSFARRGKIAAAALLVASFCQYGARAQGYVANATISDTANSDGTYNYTIVLNNSSSSMSPIGTFWFGWLPNVYSYDLLPSNPVSVTTPDGWSANSGMGYGSYYYPDGYSIEFIANTPLVPGSSVTFGFTSADSPTTLESTSPFYGAPASESYVYSSYAYSDPGAELAVPLIPVPEPSPIALLAVGVVSLCLVRFRVGKKLQFVPLKLKSR